MKVVDVFVSPNINEASSIIAVPELVAAEIEPVQIGPEPSAVAERLGDLAELVAGRREHPRSILSSVSSLGRNSRKLSSRQSSSRCLR